MNFLKFRKIFYLLSLFLIIFGGLSFYIFKPNLGIDLVGGQILEIKTKENIKLLMEKLKIKGIIFEGESMIIKSQENLDFLWQEVKKLDPQAQRLKYENISPSLSGELRKKALLTVIFVLFGIGLYVAFAFYKLKNHFSLFNLSLIVIFTLFHDVLGTTGFYILFSKFFNFDLDLKFITALLIIAGFSVHDTIVVFDRLRENILKTKSKNEEIFNASINQTLRRSIFTSLTTVLAILPLTFTIFDLRAFLLAIQIGIIVGTYSSICLATPLLYETHRS